MFERFTTEARQVVTQAQSEARQLHHRWIGTEHLLLALLAQRESSAGAVLARHGLTHGAAVDILAGLLDDELDADALRTLGIDLEQVRDRVEEAFGAGALDAARGGGCRDKGPRGHIPFSPRAKKALELSLREAIALKSRSISDGHIALGLIREGQGLATKVLVDGGVDVRALRQDLTTALAS